MRIFVDKNKCIGCLACVIACKLKHNLPPHTTKPPIAEPKGPKPIRILEVGPRVRNGEVIEYFFHAIVCNHCANPPCAKSCPASAIYTTEDGIVLVDRNKCNGCQLCLDACEYKAPQFDLDGKLVLCDLCIDRLKEGKKPLCLNVCPAMAISLLV